MSLSFSQLLQKQVIVFDGAMGTQIQDLSLTDADFGGSAYRMLSDLLVFSKPQDVRDIHLRYFQAGANAVETNTFGASRLRLKEFDFSTIDASAFAGMPDQLNLQTASCDEIAYHLNVKAAEVAVAAKKIHAAAQNYDGRPLFVVGSLGPSNHVLTSTRANLARTSYQDICENFCAQVLGLIDGGADVLLFETQQDPLELKAAIHGAQRAMAQKNCKLPIMAQVTVDAFGKMQIFNTDILSALVTVQDIGVDVFGINCSIGPEQMLPTIEKLARHSRIPISVLPNAGLPVSENGKTVFKLTPDELASYQKIFVEKFGVSVVGGCCGTRPDHIRAIANAVKNLKPAHREITKSFFVSGPQNCVELDSRDSVLRIGERLNVRGSLKVRKAVEESSPINMEVLEEVVREQVQDLGVTLIDVCMDSNLVDTDQTLVDVISGITTDFAGAMCLDSFSVESLLKAIEVYPGRPLLNSISLEEYAPGLDKIDALVGPTKNHAPVYIALTTDPTGPALTAADKFSMAKKIYEKCRDQHGLRADQLIIDINAFPIGAESVPGQNFSLETLNAIPMVKALHPDIKVSLGVGNLTNGLASKPYMRKLLTSVFMHEARKRGLDAAIINPDHYVPVDSLDQSDVELALKVILQRDMEAFTTLEEIAEVKKGTAKIKKISYDDLPLEESICQKIKDGYRSKKIGRLVSQDFIYDYQDSIVESVAEALKIHKPLSFINDFLMRSMRELGDGFARGEVSLPHLLKSADVMKQAMGYIEARLRHEAGGKASDEPAVKATVILGTVYQDVHSIGKDLVKTLLENYGYKVIDLGVQVPLQNFLDAAQKHHAQAIGMSALLVQTSNHMITVAKMLREQNMGHVDVLIGGAPVNKRHAAYVSLSGREDPATMLPNVFYCASGMDGVNIMNSLCESKDTKQRLYDSNLKELRYQYEVAIRKAASDKDLLAKLPRRQIKNDHSTRIEPVAQMIWQPKLKDIKHKIDRKTLFSLNWNYGGNKSWEKKGTSENQLNKLLDEWILRSDTESYLQPMGVAGLYACVRDHDAVTVLDPKDPKRILATIKFDLLIGKDKTDLFSVAQYFSDDPSQPSIIGLQITTGGGHVEKVISEFKADGDSFAALHLQGLSDRIAEDLAEFVHDELKSKVGCADRSGARYSPGYPALTDLSVNKVLAKILDAEKIMGISLTEAGEFSPTGTTGAVVCFHPDAGYD